MRLPGNRHPTPFPELNGVLDELVTSVKAVLEENFCAAYMQGSFALGDADVFSDVDFVVVTERDVTKSEAAALDAMHQRIYRFDIEWAQHLEGSYIPRECLRRTDSSRTRFWFLDNGATELVLDSHCNTAVVRWILREHGIVLEGPDPKALIDPVPAPDLRREAREGIREYVEWAPEPTKAGGMSRWKQPYLVLTYCRLLHTLANATVVSKRRAADWAVENLAPEWSDLVRRAVDDRPDPWKRVYQAAEPTLTDQTLAFGSYALTTAESLEGGEHDEVRI